jgi:hypothetical protein
MISQELVILVFSSQTCVYFTTNNILTFTSGLLLILAAILNLSSAESTSAAKLLFRHGVFILDECKTISGDEIDAACKQMPGNQKSK